MKITLAQLNPKVADFPGNFDLLKEAVLKAHRRQSDLIVFSELFSCGYPPLDLLDRPSFLKENQVFITKVRSLSKMMMNLTIVFGGIDQDEKGHLYNALFVVFHGEIIQKIRKQLLPTYDVFDESRYFKPGKESELVTIAGKKIGFLICEDVWANASFLKNKYTIDPVQALAQKKPDLIVVSMASPFSHSKPNLRRAIVHSHVEKTRIPFIAVNQVGANDELIFDGNSFAITPHAFYQLPGFTSSAQTIDIEALSSQQVDSSWENDVFNALVLGVKDYFEKTGFKKAVLGLSGGIDSAVTAVIATAALGKENVQALLMPSPYSSDGSITDAQALADTLGIQTTRLPITDAYEIFGSLLPDRSALADQNIQARIRGLLVMAVANTNSALGLATGNKSELAMGYSTLYGDMNGAVSVIGDLYKTEVYKLARWINRAAVVIPISSIEKPPSAELKPNQKDQDTLPPYDILDAILKRYIDETASFNDMIGEGFSEDVVKKVMKSVNQNEFKRSQAAIILKVSPKAFGIGRRYPVVMSSFWEGVDAWL